MKYSKAIKLYRCGNNIRRSSWKNPKKHLGIINSNVSYNHPPEECTRDDCEALDWEIMPPVPLRVDKIDLYKKTQPDWKAHTSQKKYIIHGIKMTKIQKYWYDKIFHSLFNNGAIIKDNYCSHPASTTFFLQYINMLRRNEIKIIEIIDGVYIWQAFDNEEITYEKINEILIDKIFKKINYKKNRYNTVIQEQERLIQYLRNDCNNEIKKLLYILELLGKKKLLKYYKQIKRTEKK